jgi:pimeloyl-ACP methyl ester carboxylesterase
MRVPWRGIGLWLRRIGIGLLALILAITAASLVFNWVTDPPDRLDPGSGRYVRVGDAEVHYMQWGAHGSPIVLVPGAFESAVVWTAVGPLLGKDHRVYAVDMPWHGYTRYAGSMKLDAQARLLSGFIGALHLSRPLLVGHSMGAAVVARVALTHPTKLAGIVFADGDALPIPVASGFGRVVLHAIATHTPYLTTVLRIAARWPSEAQSMISSLCGTPCPGLTPDLARQWVRPFGQQDEVDALHTFIGADGYGLSAEGLSRIAVPTEIIWGENDHEGGSLSGAIANLGHPPVHMIKGAGHLSMLADPRTFAAAVEAAAAAR